MTWLLLLACTTTTDTAGFRDTGGRFDPTGKLRVDQLTVDFGAVALGEQATRKLTFHNTSATAFADVWMEEEPSDRAFQVEMTETFLSPGQSAQWTILFEPSEAGDVSSSLLVWSSDSELSNTRIELLGSGTGER